MNGRNITSMYYCPLVSFCDVAYNLFISLFILVIKEGDIEWQQGH